MIAIIFAVLTVIALPIIAIARAQVKSKEVDELKREVERLNARMEFLERTEAQRNRASHVSAETPEDESRAIVEPVRRPKPEPRPDVGIYLPQESSRETAPRFAMIDDRESVSLEQHLGVNWLNRVGITLVVLGVAVFLVYHVSHLGPWVKILGGFVAATALFITGLKFEKKERYQTLAYVALGGAWAVTFVTTYAMHFFDATRVLQSEMLDLILLLAVSIGMIAHAMRYRSQLLTGIAFMMAFSTVTMSQHDGYSLIANVLLAGSLVFISMQFDWPELEIAGLVAAYGNHAKWFFTQRWESHTVPHFWASATVLTLLFLIFRQGSSMRRPAGHAPQLERVFIPVLNSALWCALAAGPQSPTLKWSFGFLLMACVLDLAFSYIARKADPASQTTLESLALLELLIAVPCYVNGIALPLVWATIGQMVVLLALRRKMHRMAGVGICIIAMAIFTGLIRAFDSGVTGSAMVKPSLAFFALALLLWFDGGWLYRRLDAPTTDRADAMYTGAAFLASFSAATGVWLVMPGWQILAAWSALGIAVFAVGLLLTERRLRLAGLGLLLLSVAKLSTYDAWQFEPTARYLSLIGVGIALLAVSFAYSRYTDRIKALL
ncbi:MAG: DUF2339 domain-containing protein [Acidobacteria bacterium]|nr:DUF2339 domain-containing protein [Acidobacteriota bacterium]